jgi:hypothetical protein
LYGATNKQPLTPGRPEILGCGPPVLHFLIDMLINRIGTFFILLGIFLVVLFVLSDIAQAPTCNFLIIGGVSLSLGIFLWFKDPAPPGPPTGRFRIFKNKGSKNKKQEKK